MSKKYMYEKTYSPIWLSGRTELPFEITSMNVTGPYPSTPRKNLLNFIEHFTKYVEATPFQTKRPKHALESMRLGTLHDTAQFQNSLRIKAEIVCHLSFEKYANNYG